MNHQLIRCKKSKIINLKNKRIKYSESVESMMVMYSVKLTIHRRKLYYIYIFMMYTHLFNVLSKLIFSDGVGCVGLFYKNTILLKNKDKKIFCKKLSYKS